ncbi:phosphotransferase [Streptomyces aurantiacus]|uniref:phosphotransferase n=1 Tax=Streptomyces aurantiacus TaxID=47760 RepID=UPI00131A4289|nr:phosphotransferase [Streptomyces aurantiacus]
MPTAGPAFRLLPEIKSSRLEDVTRSISQDVSSKVKDHLARKGVTLVGENSRRQVMGRGRERFYKSLTMDSARRLENFYPSLRHSALSTGFVPRLIEIERIDEQVGLACFEYVRGRVGHTRDTKECFTLYCELQTAALRESTQPAQALIDVCRNEVSTWNEGLLQSWDPVNWSDPKILNWAGVDAAAMTEIGIPALRSVPSLLTALSGDEKCTPVHADLYVGNLLRTPDGRSVIVDWDEGYWGLPGMGLQILLREAMDEGVEGLEYENLLELAPGFAALGLSEADLAIRTLAGAVVEIAGVRQSLRELNRPRERHAAYLAAWACRYAWAIKKAHSL